MASPFGPKLNGFHDPRAQLAQHLIERAKEFFDAHRQRKLQITTAEDVRSWQQRTRETFLRAIDGLPHGAGELNPRVLGTIDQPKYVIEKVVFESLPKVYVTANLYLPKSTIGGSASVPTGSDGAEPSNSQKRPAVLFLCGHTRAAKGYAEYHQVCALLAKNGFVALAMDPIGQGERLQMIDRKTAKELVPWGTTEHSYIGLPCTLIGQNIARYFIHDAMRAVDYLISRPEVDEKRIGVTGNSGGGTQSTYLLALDDRIAAAAPGTYITNRERYIITGQAHDAEQNLFGAIAQGIDHDDLLVCFAPKPLLVLASAWDFFPIEGTLETVQSARWVYRMLGGTAMASRCDLVIGEHGHAYADPLKLAALRFFAKWLDPTRKVPLDLAIDPPVDADSLKCTRSGHVLLEYPDAASVLDLVARDVPKRDRPSQAQVRQRVGELVFGGRSRPPVMARMIATQGDDQGRNSEQVYFFSEPGNCVAGVFVKAGDSTGRLRTTVVLLPDGTAELAKPETMKELARFCGKGRAMFIFDPRGVGSLQPESGLGEGLRQHYGPWFKLAYDAFMLGDSLAAIRAFDVTRALDYLRARPDVEAGSIDIYARGECGFIGLLAAVADGRIAKIDAPNLPQSYADVVAAGQYDRKLLNEWTVLHGMLNEFDLDDLRGAAGMNVSG